MQNYPDLSNNRPKDDHVEDLALGELDHRLLSPLDDGPEEGNICCKANEGKNDREDIICLRAWRRLRDLSLPLI